VSVPRRGNDYTDTLEPPSGVIEYNADPDDYAAKHLGFQEVDDHCEWVATNGTALCSVVTRHGRR